MTGANLQIKRANCGDKLGNAADEREDQLLNEPTGLLCPFGAAA